MGFVKHLMSPIEVRGKVFRNRIIAAPSLMSIMMHEDGIVTSDEWLRQKIDQARGGMAAAMIGETVVDTVWADRWNIRYQMDDPFYRDIISTMHTDFTNPDTPKRNTWRHMAQEIHRNGALAFVQIAHAGNMRIGLGNVPEGVPTAVGPMGYTRPNGEIVKAAGEEDLAQIAQSFATCARFMKDAGFDGVQVHAGHGWLLTQFLSERCNRRDDEYGGSMEKRCNFPLRVMRAIRDAVGDDFVVEMRVSGEETGVPGGYKVDQIITLSQMAEGIVDIMHLSNGHYNRHYTSHSGGGDMYDPHIVNLRDAIAVKENTRNMLVNVVGGVNNPEECDRLIGEGKIDFVSMAKQIYADPDFANKCWAGRTEDIQRCVRCLYCNGGGNPDLEVWDVTPVPRSNDGPASAPLCSVNPQRGLEPPEGGWPAVETARRVLVVGGGVAGMTAAITARDRGHFVTIIEKSGRLGGTMNFTDKDEYKADYMNYKNLLIRRVEERRIDVRLGAQLTPALMAELKPEFVIAAVGASYSKPDIPGIENAMSALEAYEKGVAPGGSAVMLGSHMFAGEVAVWLAGLKDKVTSLKVNRPGLSAGRFTLIVQKKLDELGVDCLTDEEIEEVTKDGVVLRDGRLIPADTVVYHFPLTPLAGDVEKIKALAGDAWLASIGDCEKARDVANSIREAYVSAMGIS